MSVRRSLAWMMISQCCLFVLQFGGSVVLARLLTPYDMGIYALASAIIGILNLVQAFGLTALVVSEPEIDGSFLTSVFTINVMLAIVLALAVAGSATFGGALFHEPKVQHVLVVLAVVPLLGVFEFLPATNLQREAKFRSIAVVGLLKSASTTAISVTLAFAGYSYMSMAWGAIAGSAASAIGFMVAGRRHVGFRFGLTAWRRILRFGTQQLAIQGVNAISGRAAELLLGRLLGLSALGLYGRAANLNNLLWSNIHLVVGRVVFVDLAEQRRLGIDLRAGYLRTVEIVTALLWPCFAGLALLAGPLVTTLYGRPWAAAGPPLSALSVSAILLVSITMTWEVFVVCGETGRQARFEFVRSAVGLALFCGGAFVSLTGAAIARIGEAAFSIFLYRPHLQRMTNTIWADFVPIYRRSAILTIAACGPALVLMILYGWSPHVPVGPVAIAVVAGFAAWLVTLHLMRHLLVGEVRRLVTKGKQVVRLA